MGAYLRSVLAISSSPWSQHLVPGWAAFQLAAMLAALGLLALRVRSDRRPLLCLAIAFPGAALFAAGLGAALKVPDWLRSGFDGRVFLQASIYSWGALIGLAGTYALSARRMRMDVAGALDLIALALGPVVALARAGCFLGGCDFGTVTSLPWAARFPPASPAFRAHLAGGLVLPTDHASLAVHPTQLYEAGLGLVVLLVALAVERARPRPGAVFAAAAATYAAGRWAIEWLRADRAATQLGPFSASQWIGAAVLVAGALWVARSGRRARGPSGAAR